MFISHGRTRSDRQTDKTTSSLERAALAIFYLAILTKTKDTLTQ